MLDSLPYAALFQYSPRGESEMSRQSRKVRDAIKGGRIESLRNQIKNGIESNQDLFFKFLNKEVTLVPIPRSSLIRESDLWPAFEISKLFASLQLGNIDACLVRHQAIKKSALFFNADQRPSIAEQYNSLRVENSLPTSNITLVDDVVTLGRTSIACASRLADKFPNATIRVFSLIQTMGLVPNVSEVLNPISSTITYNSVSGKCSRHS